MLIYISREVSFNTCTPKNVEGYIEKKKKRQIVNQGVIILLDVGFYKGGAIFDLATNIVIVPKRGLLM